MKLRGEVRTGILINHTNEGGNSGTVYRMKRLVGQEHPQEVKRWAKKKKKRRNNQREKDKNNQESLECLN